MLNHNFNHQFILLKPVRPQTLDEHWMNIALQESIKGQGLTKPNPMVGAVLVSGNNILISTGYHKRFGDKHAEVIAIENANNQDLSQATLYTTLEPCCHTNKKTPPCLPLILEKKIKRVVISLKDPNPSVAGKSIAVLREHGVNVTTQVLEDASKYLLRDYIYKNIHRRPYIHLKIAMTLDGSFSVDATFQDRPKWFTNSQSKHYVHFLRALADGICIGGNTFRTDKPQLSCRIESFNKNPHFNQPKKFLLTQNPSKENEANYQVLQTLNHLLALEVQLLLIEAGPKLASLLLQKNLMQELSVILTPNLVGSMEKLTFEHFQNNNDNFDINNGSWYQCDNNVIYHWHQ